MKINNWYHSLRSYHKFEDILIILIYLIYFINITIIHVIIVY